MKCDLCDKKASVFLTQIVDGNMKKISLCESCADKKHVSDPTSFGLADLFPEISPGKTQVLTLGVKQSCSECGFTQEDLQRTARLGCPACYNAFRSGIEMNLPAMHRNGTRHVGRVPRRHARRIMLQRAGQFRKDLETAVEKEDFEEAARLRDQIRQCESLGEQAPGPAGTSTLPSGTPSP